MEGRGRGEGCGGKCVWREGGRGEAVQCEERCAVWRGERVCDVGDVTEGGAEEGEMGVGVAGQSQSQPCSEEGV